MATLSVLKVVFAEEVEEDDVVVTEGWNRTDPFRDDDADLVPLVMPFSCFPLARLLWLIPLPLFLLLLFVLFLLLVLTCSSISLVVILMLQRKKG